VEALLKLVVGVDGVTAEMLVHIANLWVLVHAITVVGYIAGFVGFAAVVCYTIRWGINRNCEMREAGVKARYNN